MDEPGVRVDRWLWAARIVKTRGLAAEAVKGGRVHINGRAVKPSREVKAGDRLEVSLGRIRLVLDVRGVAERRGPAKEAQLLYEETAESRTERERLREQERLARPMVTDLGGRPTKRDRRRLDALRPRRRG